MVQVMELFSKGLLGQGQRGREGQRWDELSILVCGLSSPLDGRWLCQLSTGAKPWGNGVSSIAH